jgi:hypothetical protein
MQPDDAAGCHPASIVAFVAGGNGEQAIDRWFLAISRWRLAAASPRITKT